MRACPHCNVELKDLTPVMTGVKIEMLQCISCQRRFVVLSARTAGDSDSLCELISPLVGDRSGDSNVE